MNGTGRHEKKHRINYADYLQLRARLQQVARPDENAVNGGSYRVMSLYFDNYSDKALREKLDGVNDREKFRLRYYNGDTSFIRLEKKSKHAGLCYKQSTSLTATQCAALLRGELDILKQNADPLCMELYAKMRCELLRPKNLVDYKREAYVYEAGNVRVTIDSDLRRGTDVTQFLSPHPITVPIPGVMILEVKYDAFLPEIIRGIVTLSSRQAAAFSKYAAARIG